MSRLSQLLRRALKHKVRREIGGIRARLRVDCGSDLKFIETPELFEEEQLAAMLKELRDDDVVYEIGAHIGLWTVFLAQKVSRGELHAFEPDGANRKQLEANLALNAARNVSVHDFAISDHSGKAEFAVFAGEREARHSLVIADEFDRKVEVDTLRLDDAPERLGIAQPTALKIDVEGAEGWVLAGAATLLKGGGLRLVYVEFHTRMLQTGWTEEQVLDLLEGNRFRVVERWMRGRQLQVLAARG